jgi:hypothetical protein
MSDLYYYDPDMQSLSVPITTREHTTPGTSQLLIYIFTHLFVHLSIRKLICLLIDLFDHLFICKFIHSFISNQAIYLCIN